MSRPTIHLAQPGIWITFLLLVAACSGAAVGQTISLPLEGYYRPGRYMPVQVGPGVRLTLEPPGDIAVDVEPQARSIVLPMLMLDDQARVLQAAGRPLELHPLSPDEALVGSTSDATEVAAAVLPDRKNICIRLDPAALLDGVPVAWESLDALVLDTSSMQRLDDARRSALLSAGVVLAAIGPTPPDAAWPWQRGAGAANLWILRHLPAGPSGCDSGEDGYAPTLGWAPTWPASIRRSAAAAGTGLAVIVVVAAAQVRRRGALAAVAALCLCTTVAVAAWRRALGPVSDGGGDVLVVDPTEQLAQRDAWLYQRGRDDADCIVTWTGPTHPMLSDAEQARTRSLRLRIRADGTLQFAYRTAAGATLAFMRRDTTPLTGRLNPAVSGSLGHSPMEVLARELYLGPDGRIIGEAPAGPQRWPSVVLAR